MKPSVFTPLLAMYLSIAAAMMSSLGTTLNAHLRLSSIGCTIAVEAASDSSGVLLSSATSSIGMVTGVSDEPMMTSTPSWMTRRRAFCRPLTLSDSSSSAM